MPLNEVKGADLLGLEGKTVVVSGGAVNIGRAVSRTFARAGASVAVIYNSSSGPAGELVTEITAEGGTAAAFRADISSEEEVAEVFGAIAGDSRFGGIDVLVNNSGVFSLGLQTELSADEWQRIFDINVKGLFLCSREAARKMKAQAGRGAEAGCIVNVASINAIHPGFGMTAHYDATKGAVAAYTRSLAAELGADGIRVNAVAPGLVESEGLRENAPDLAGTVEVRNPLKTGGGECSLVHAEDVADAAVFLASKMARSITGELLVVDRGYLLT